MDDEAEIDIIGDYNSFETILKKNDQIITTCYEDQLGLQCDSQWLIDSSSQPWDDARAEPQSSLGLTIDGQDPDVWTDKEKYLLEKGLELFGRSWSRLSQYIGSKNSSQVKSYVKSTGIGYSGKISTSTPSFSVDIVDFEFSDVINEMEIPASMEEVIAVVSTAQPTVVVPSHRENNPSTDHLSSKCKKRHKINNNTSFKRSHLNTQRKKGPRNVFNAEDIKDVFTDNKEQDSIILPNGEQVIRIRNGSSLSEESEVDIDSDNEDKKNVQGIVDTNVNGESHEIENKNASLSDCDNDDKEKSISMFHFPSDGHNEEVTLEYVDINCPAYFTLDNIEKEECVCTESDSDNKDDKVLHFMPVEASEKKIFSQTNSGQINEKKKVSRENVVVPTEKEISANSDSEKETHIFRGNLVTPSGKVMTVVVDDVYSDILVTKGSELPMQDIVSRYMRTIQDQLDAVYRLPPPVREITVDAQFVTQEEKRLHPEFFDKKDPTGLLKYLKIRNPIINCWKKYKPTYITKKFAGLGLKDCGDENLISRVHAYLEQKGIINFGCKECHYIQSSVTQPVKTNTETSVDKITRQDNDSEHILCEKRGTPRIRKKKLPFEESYDQVPTISTSPTLLGKCKRTRTYGKLKTPDSWKSHKKIRNPNSNEGFTMVHTDSGEVIVQHNQTTEPRGIKSRRMKPVRLIHCKHYSGSNKAPYKVEVEISALMLVDIHSHLSPVCEVIGLLGGVYRSAENLVSIVTAVPCKTILSSNIHCDMCPVSQAEGSELITSQGLSVLGWYHSHPNFDPSPSITDIDTQNMLQTWFNKTGKPFVGLIISPYYLGNTASSYRVCQVKMEHNGPIPYQLDVKAVNQQEINLPSFRESVEAACKTLGTSKTFKSSTVQKCHESLRQHMKNSKVTYEKMAYVLKEVSDILREKIC